MRQTPFVLALVGLLTGGSLVRAQDATTVPCATPDSIGFRGQSQITDADLRTYVGIAPKTVVNSRILSRALHDLYATNRFESAREACETVDGKTVLIFYVKERRVLSDVRVQGAEKVSANSVRDRVDLIVGKAIDPAQVAKDVARIDSLYQSESYYLARVKVDTLTSGDATTLVFRVDEGRRLAISGVRDRRKQSAVRQGDRQGDLHQARRVFLVAERRVRLRQICRGSLEDDSADVRHAWLHRYAGRQGHADRRP